MSAPEKVVQLPDGAPIDVEGNRLELLADCDARIERYIALVDAARHSIDVISYVFEDDGAGRRVRASFIAAAQRGVRIRLVVDSFGSGDTDHAFFDELRNAGVAVEFFSRRWRSSYLIRNHQKMLIIDGETLLFGGFNISDCYFDGCGTTGWTDLGLMLTGPAAVPMVDWFERLFAFTQHSDGQWLKLRRLIVGWQRANPPSSAFQWLVGGPTQRLSPWARAIRSDLSKAQRVDMAMAYFSPGQGMLRRLGRLARRGQARVITAARTDNAATIGAARLLYGYMLRRGVTILEYQPQRLHMKLVVADNAVYVGSANFDMRSLFLNLEVMLRIDDPTLAGQARAVLDKMAEESEKITLAWVKQRGGWLTRLRWFLSWFIVSTLDYNVVRRLNFGLESDPDPVN
ncbi:MAG: phosphatidylserine/phosphatidylglycerophosphate/cardiolipin synthase family protein [Sphingopyxis sp.]|nr:phosphatidylserine/phosphatidylglycerophosphate/cardiolipin synthase family protein [Sphingopyxis sp.]